MTVNRSLQVSRHSYFCFAAQGFTVKHALLQMRSSVCSGSPRRSATKPGISYAIVTEPMCLFIALPSRLLTNMDLTRCGVFSAQVPLSDHGLMIATCHSSLGTCCFDDSCASRISSTASPSELQDLCAVISYRGLTMPRG